MISYQERSTIRKHFQNHHSRIMLLIGITQEYSRMFVYFTRNHHHQHWSKVNKALASPATLSNRYIGFNTMNRDRESVRSLTPQSQRGSQRRHSGLKMQTLPVPEDLKPHETVRTTQEEDALEGERDEYQRRPPHSSFERDDDFKFKRHKRRNNTGVASLGERLDNIQELQNARWMENFNSSANNLDRLPRNSQRDDSQDSQKQRQQPEPMLPIQAPPYMPYMYYYPYAPPMVPHMSTSPTRPSDQELVQYVNSSQAYPNTSTQPFLPPMHASSNRLMPAPPLYPNYSAYNYYNDVQSTVAKKSHQRRERRSTLMAQRGRRLSILSTQDNSHIISPHKDVPEDDFYRHIANTSFGQDLQIRQLFSWCFIRCLRKWETKDGQLDKPDASNDGEAYVNPKRIALVIIKEFVDELRKGKAEVSWDAEESREGAQEDHSQYQEEDTELRELFEDDDDDDDDDNDDDNNIRDRKRARRKGMKGNRKPSIKVPNEKNIQNAKNMEVLQMQINTLDEEIKDWIHELDEPEGVTEWHRLGNEISSLKTKLTSSTPSPVAGEVTDPLAELEGKLQSRMAQFHAISHFLHSNSQLLTDSVRRKLQIMSNTINENTFLCQGAGRPSARTSTKDLLLGLSRSLTNQSHNP
ncbi:LADA_0H07580g1_1 [Lachancea dasiensis]|uniref:LADA_0H07580g1_1 n=1 Tax=Lachancea dasiensis TaxID=1072105 RepID=A0A1G4K239_9SACH|nr:LADA_0H07580g1_1 [Lachancea dasiensis]